jgi:hypothetical protein
MALVLVVGASCAAGAPAAQVATPHAEAAALVKGCQAALGEVGVGPVWKVHVARVKVRVATAVAACDSKGNLGALAKAAPNDRGLADASSGEAGVLEGLANFRKYLTDVATGKSGHTPILTYAKGEVEQADILLGQALLELK